MTPLRRVAFVAAYSAWDDAAERVRAAPVGHRPTAATLQRETNAKESAAKRYAEHVGLTTIEMLGLVAAMRRHGWDLNRCCDAIEAIGTNHQYKAVCPWKPAMCKVPETECQRDDCWPMMPYYRR